MEARRSIKLTIPPQSAQTLRFCDGSNAGVRAWAAKLPVQHPLKTAKHLHDALLEANRTTQSPELRFAQLEMLRPYVLTACSAMTRRRRDTPLLVDERARREAALAQRVQYQLAIGYKIVIVDALKAGMRLSAADAPGTNIVVTAIHRAMTELVHTLFRSLQFYTPVPERLWQELHALYSLAELRGVTGSSVLDDQKEMETTPDLSDVYEQAILLATAQPNKLRQADLGVLFSALQAWTRLTRVVPADAVPSPLMIMDLGGSGPPVSPRRHRGAGELLRTVDTRVLVSALRTWLDGDPATAHPHLPLVTPEHLELVRHCARVWGEVSDRSHERTPGSGNVDVCAGLADVHFHAGGGRSLLRQMQSERIEEEQDADDEVVDPFAGASDLGGVRVLDDSPAPRRHVSSESEDAGTHPISSVALADVSPIGFGLVCTQDVPAGLFAGQVLGIRESGDPDWRIGLVRWIANEAEHPRLGVETLAQRALSGGARVISSKGREIEFSRALLLPGIDALEQPPFLITVPETFSEGQKIAFTQGGREHKLLVEERVSVTESYEYFEVRELVTTANVEQDTGIEVEVMSEEDERLAMAAFGFSDESTDSEDPEPPEGEH